MFNPINEFDKMCDKMNIPRDRRELVKRNLQLRGYLQSTLNAMSEMQEHIHSIHHTGEYDTCAEQLCIEFKQSLQKTKAVI